MKGIVVFLGMVGFMLPLVAATNAGYVKWRQEAMMAARGGSVREIMGDYLQWYDLLVENVEYKVDLLPWEGTNSLFVIAMKPEKTVGTVVFLHGYLDHVGSYPRWYGFLLEKGYQVIAMDLPGHGLSSGLRTGIGDFVEYEQALEVLLEQKWVPQEFVAVGFSTGCSVWMEYLHLHPRERRVKALVLFSPLVRLANWNMALMGYNILGNFVQEIPRTEKKITSDEEVLRFIYTRDPLQEKRIHLSWFLATRNWHERFIQYPVISRSLPVLIVQGRDDTVVDWRYNIPMIQRVFLKTVVEYFSGEHDILMETNSAMVYESFLRFVEGL